MFSVIQQGSVRKVQGLECHIPEEGYVYNKLTGQIEFRGVYARSEITEEQYWERIPLPTWYASKIKEEDAYEKRRKEIDPPFYDETYERYKQQEWDRRLNGFWFYNNGKATYITGSHYVYMQWWQIDIGYPKFRIPDLEYFYFLEYCIEDPESMGMLEVTKRRFGKTFRGGLFLFEYPSRTRMTNGGIQSKTGTDGKKVFGKAVVNPFKKMPRFFRPEYDMSLGITPKTEIRFQQTNVRGKKAEAVLEKEELGSMIDWQSADLTAYDGQKLHRYFCDEWGKTTEVNVYDRHDVLRYCLLDDEGRIIGKALYSTTVEKLDTERDGIQDAARKLWEDSDHMNKGENGRTASGLYRYFMPADHARNFDKYGYPDVEKTRKQILADRKTVEHNPRSLAARIRKEALTIQEAFSVGGDECAFNAVKIQDQINYLEEHPPMLRRVTFFRNEDQSVSWRDDSEGFWEILAFPPNGSENKHVYELLMKKPDRREDGVISIDGYANSQGGKYGSKAGAYIIRKFDISDPQNSGMPIAQFYGRPREKSILHEQILLAGEYYGYAANWELAADDYYTYYKERGRLKYLMKCPRSAVDPLKDKDKELPYGYPTTEFALTKALDEGISYVENYCSKIYFIDLLKQMLKFLPSDRTKSDLVVAFINGLVAAKETVSKPKRTEPLVRVYARTA